MSPSHDLSTTILGWPALLGGHARLTCSSEGGLLAQGDIVGKELPLLCGSNEPIKGARLRYGITLSSRSLSGHLVLISRLNCRRHTQSRGDNKGRVRERSLANLSHRYTG